MPLIPQAARAEPAPPTVAVQPNRYELSAVPALSFDSDRGFGFGAVGVLARFAQGYLPFRWRLHALAYLTAKDATGSGVSLTSQKYRLRLDLPGLVGGALRLNLDLRFERDQSSYYGLGNASPAAEGALDHLYQRTFPRLRAQARLKLTQRLSMMLAGSFTYNWIAAPEGSKLAADLSDGDERVTGLLRGIGHHAVALANAGVVWDSRDHEFAPSRGAFHELSWRFAPGLSPQEDLTYGGLNLTLRFFRSLYRGDKVVFAARMIGDLLFGHPPLQALARHGGLHPDCSIGGGAAVRGVPRLRYHGKVRLLGNAELRFKLLPFSLFGQRFNLGTIAFFDAGRVWADYSGRADLDGAGLGLKLGTGGGLRFQWGETFIARVDVAWSPDADPIGVYFNVNHIF